MKNLLAGCCVLALAQAAAGQSASEKADQRLAELLAPRGGRVAFVSRPAAWPESKAMTVVEVPLLPYAGPPASLPVPVRKPVKPGALPAATPLLAFRDGTQVPALLQLPTKPLIWVPSLDAKTPAAIPILAKPASDRASLGDPAFEASLAAALKAVAPARTTPTPFVPLNLPDPFEHLRYGQLRNPPPEDPMPPLLPFVTPMK